MLTYRVIFLLGVSAFQRVLCASKFRDEREEAERERPLQRLTTNRLGAQQGIRTRRLKQKLSAVVKLVGATIRDEARINTH